MEAYPGVLVCCTNLLVKLDTAALRRFSFKVSFKPLSEEGRLVLFRRYFPEVELMIEAAERLARLEGLTPGDFKAVLMRRRFSPSLEAEGLIADLVAESSYRHSPRSIGFKQ